jgi:hypothetical protein
MTTTPPQSPQRKRRIRPRSRQLYPHNNNNRWKFITVLRTCWNILVIIGGIVVAISLTRSSSSGIGENTEGGGLMFVMKKSPKQASSSSTAAASKSPKQILDDFLPFPVSSLDRTSIDLSEYRICQCIVRLPCFIPIEWNPRPKRNVDLIRTTSYLKPFPTLHS